MKFLAALCILGLAICFVKADISDETKEKYHKLQKACIEKSGTTLEVVKAARLGTFPEDAKLAGYFKCIFDKMGFMCEDGTTHPDVMLEKVKPRIEETKAKEIIDTCLAKTYSNVDTKAYEMFQCFRQSYGKSVDLV